MAATSGDLAAVSLALCLQPIREIHQGYCKESLGSVQGELRVRLNHLHTWELPTQTQSFTGKS